MVFKGFKAIILALLFVSFVLQSLCAHGFGERRLMEANSIILNQVNDASLTKKEVVAGAVGSGSSSDEAKIGGRKMGMKKLKKEDGEMASRKGDAQKLNVEAGFVAFTADYHSAKHHPPRNN